MGAVLRWLFVGQFAVIGLSGCSDGRPTNSNGSPPPATREAVSELPAANNLPAHPTIEITPAAQSQLLRIGEQANLGERLRVRLEVVAGGCSGMYHKLDLDLGPMQPSDAVQPCGPLDCVYAKSQLPFVQGSVIDWVKTEKEQGLKVTSPNQTAENQEKTRTWITQESEKRLKQIREEIDSRIAELRKVAAGDPDNELAHLRLAQLLMDDGKHKEAVVSFDRVLTLSPKIALAHQLLGECLISLKEWDRAIRVLKSGKAIADSLADKALSSELADLLAEAESAAPDGKK